MLLFVYLYTTLIEYLFNRYPYEYFAGKGSSKKSNFFLSGPATKRERGGGEGKGLATKKNTFFDT